MKIPFLLSLSALLILGLGACSTPPPPSSAPTIVVVPSPSPDVQPSNESTPEQEPSTPPIPADAAMYRGTVIQVSSATPPADGSLKGLYEVTLEQAEGTNFGAPSLKFAFTADTRADFTPEQGQYLEVYYGVAPGQQVDANAVHDIITAVMYHSADMVNYNGTLLAIEPNPDKPGQGRLVMESITAPEQYIESPIIVDRSDEKKEEPFPPVVELLEESQNEVESAAYIVHFNYDKDKTKFYLNFDEIKVGDRLNIFQSGAMTMSLPPQAFAIEVRNYAEPEGTPTPKTTVAIDPNAVIMEMKFDQSVYTGMEQSLYYTVTNKTSQDFGFGMGEGFQHKVNGEWVDYPAVKDSYPDIAIIATANSSAGDSLDLSYYEAPLPAGSYRIVRKYGDKEYYAEFSVE